METILDLTFKDRSATEFVDIASFRHQYVTHG